MSDGTIEWVRLELDVQVFDAAPFAELMHEVGASGITLTTLADLGDTPEQRRSLFELNAECSKDIPGRGEFHSWPEYQRIRFDAPSFDPRGVILAVDNDRWVGMSAISHRDGSGYAFIDMTGTVRSHRGRGIATAMKVAGVLFAEDLGVRTIRTVHHPGNDAMITLNRRLGYADATWPYPST